MNANLVITEKINQEEWENFLLGFPRPPFLQSWYMREVHETVGESSLLIGVKEDNILIGVAFVVIVRAKRGHFFYLPYGPVFQMHKWQYVPELTQYVVKKAKELNIDFIRSSPFIVDAKDNRALYYRAGWRRAPLHMLAEHVWWLDITPAEDTLLVGMRKTMRNLIRRATRDGVTIRMSKNPDDVEHFIRIHKSTVERHGFVPYKDDFFRAQFRAFVKADQVAMFLAEYEGKVIAAAMIMFYGDMASYHHGASLSEFQKIPASYLLQWEAIREAKRRGCLAYNFWGIVPENKMRSRITRRPHPFAGVTTFKTGFGGERIDLLPCQDYPIRSKYYLTRIIETARRIKRGFW
ncbi:MAG: peptidoglycan bridge formation glycyltransferase FemA/FemB family protein [Candidatus Kerfeldbacteria bacterium]|nr:peptidoglycan bridge formation glycyltransferase FemA/FemB family protein [Candidatus Kerfeldbacteria bacterium]